MNSVDTSDVIIAKHRSHKSDQVAVQKMQVKVPPGAPPGREVAHRSLSTLTSARVFSAFFQNHITIVGRELHFLDATCAIINFKYTVLMYPPALSLPL